MQSTGYNIDVKANNITFCYDDLGEGSIPVIFIHGFPFDKSMWHDQLDYLKLFHRVIAYDIRDFGKSTKDETEASIDLFAVDLMLFMDVLQIEKAIVCGLSMGGYIALKAVNKYPKRFVGLILCDTQCIADSAEQKSKRYKTIEQIYSGGLIDFAEGFIKNVFCENSFTDKKELVEKTKNVVLYNSQHAIAEGLMAMAERRESCSSLSSISVPTFILCGKEDLLTPVTQSQFMHENIKNSELKIIDKAGHLSNMEQPDEFNKYLKDFLEKF
jgi:3-oxoadipate enol-lactonase